MLHGVYRKSEIGNIGAKKSVTMPYENALEQGDSGDSSVSGIPGCLPDFLAEYVSAALGGPQNIKLLRTVVVQKTDGYPHDSGIIGRYCLGERDLDGPVVVIFHIGCFMLLDSRIAADIFIHGAQTQGFRHSTVNHVG